MNIQRRFRTISGLVVLSTTFAISGPVAFAQDAQNTPTTQGSQKATRATVEGWIIGRSGSEMTVKTNDTPRLTVVLSDSTKTKEKGGFLGMGRKDPGINALVPGLAVKVEGSYDPDHKLIAREVTFSGSALKTAKQIDAGLNPVNEQVAAAQDAIKSDQKNIAQAQQDIGTNKQDIATTKQDLGTTTEAGNQNKQAIGQTNQRVGSLDQYETKDTLTIKFANGKTAVSKKYKDQLADFVKTAASTPGAVIQVQGYASTVGSASLNQRLSAERANNVLTIIQQSGAVPLTKILAPAAMGTTNPAEEGRSRSAQAENRRVVVTILVNKGISG